MQTDTTLAEAFQTGDRDAFAKLIHKYQNYVASVVYSSTGDLTRSEDITQQTFLVAWQKHQDLEDPNKILAWLRGIAKNLTRNEYRKQQSDESRRQLLSQQIPQADQATPLANCISREQSQVLWEILERIPETYREPLILFYREGKSIAKVAEIMELTEDAVKQRLSRGRKMVKAEIEGFVEEALFETRPSENFSATVLAALPIAGGTLAAKTGGTAVGGIVGIKSLAFLAGPLIGIAGAFIGCKAALKSTTSDEERSFMKRMIFWMTAYAIGFVMALYGLAVFAPALNSNIGVQATIWSVYLVVLLVIIRWTNRRIAGIKKEFGPDPKAEQREALAYSVSTTALRWNAIGATVGPLAVFVVMPVLTLDWTFLAIVLALISVVVYFIWIMAPSFKTSPDQVRFNAMVMLPVTLGATIILLLRWDHWMAVKPVEPVVAGWVPGIGFLLFGLGLSWMLFRRADKMETELNLLDATFNLSDEPLVEPESDRGADSSDPMA